MHNILEDIIISPKNPEDIWIDLVVKNVYKFPLFKEREEDDNIKREKKSKKYCEKALREDQVRSLGARQHQLYFISFLNRFSFVIS